jgi:hypothetical protein
MLMVHRYLQGHFVTRKSDGQHPQQQQQQLPQQQQQQQQPVMYKLKDWPPSADIREKLCRHYAVGD